MGPWSSSPLCQVLEAPALDSPCPSSGGHPPRLSPLPLPPPPEVLSLRRTPPPPPNSPPLPLPRWRSPGRVARLAAEAALLEPPTPPPSVPSPPPPPPRDVLLESKRLAKLVLDYAQDRRSGADGAMALMELFTVAGGQQQPPSSQQQLQQPQQQGGGNSGNNTGVGVAVASGPQSFSVIDYSFIDQFVREVWMQEGYLCGCH